MNVDEIREYRFLKCHDWKKCIALNEIEYSKLNWHHAKLVKWHQQNFEIVFWRGNVGTGTGNGNSHSFSLFLSGQVKSCFFIHLFWKTRQIISVWFLDLLCSHGYVEIGTGNANFFHFFQGKRIGKKKKTSVKSCNLNPYWNESFVFLIDEMDMKRVYLDVTVCTVFVWIL